ncbi:MAG: T9SS type A sorting domain-containing protein, partial [Bacteroidetes bacterium]|nr:T9SS type A sorting domain-containing protein [Bacteroidota bacterium]
FSAYPDFMTIEPSAKALFKDAAGTNVYGVKNSGATFNTVFLALDAGALQFRGDTSLHNAGYTTVTDPKYQWIVDIGSISNSFFNSVTSVKPVGEAVPGQFTLGQNYPNPFNPTTQIEYNVPVRSNVAINIFNILGQKVASIVNDVHEAGTHRATWNGKDFSGKTVASGIYFYQMQSGSFEQVKKMMLMK